MTRPRKQPAEQRLTRLPCPRVTPAELAHVERQAITAGLSAAEFVRRAALGVSIAPRRSRSDDALLVELNRIGVNLNQMARATNSGRPPLAGELLAALAELRSALEKLHRSEREAEAACGQIDADSSAGETRPEPSERPAHGS